MERRRTTLIAELAALSAEIGMTGAQVGREVTNATAEAVTRLRRGEEGGRVDESKTESEMKHGHSRSFWAASDESLSWVVEMMNEELERATYDDDVVAIDCDHPRAVVVGNRIVWVASMSRIHACRACRDEGRGPRHEDDGPVDDVGKALLRKLFGREEDGGPGDPRD